MSEIKVWKKGALFKSMFKSLNFSVPNVGQTYGREMVVLCSANIESSQLRNGPALVDIHRERCSRAGSIARTCAQNKLCEAQTCWLRQTHTSPEVVLKLKTGIRFITSPSKHSLQNQNEPNPKTRLCFNSLDVNFIFRGH